MSSKNQPDFGYAGVMATVVSQVGCVTIFLIVAALGIGMALDSWLGTNGIFAGVFVLASVPISLFLVMRVSLRAITKLQKAEEAKKALLESEQIEEQAEDAE